MADGVDYLDALMIAALPYIHLLRDIPRTLDTPLRYHSGHYSDPIIDGLDKIYNQLALTSNSYIHP